jgi:hypothetical protein
MTLDETLWQKLGSWRPPAGRHDTTVVEENTGWTATVTADRCDELGCLVWDLELRRSQTATPRLDLQGWAQAIEKRVTGLLETLKVVEIDVVRNEGLLRSKVPSRRGDSLSYYEILLRGTTGAEVRRYQAKDNSTTPREQVAFALTHEVLARFVADLTADM